MKEVKEVVHVPTRELAEEVLRVAKENGFKMPRFELEYYLKTSGEELCFRFNEAYFSFANKGFYKEEGDIIITAEEFLNRYKDSEIEQLRKENAYLEECIGLEKQDKESLEREIHQLKQRLKAIEDQPKVGDVCLFWDGLNKYYSLEILSEIIKGKECIYRTHNNDEYANCIKATDENIKSKIKELKND